MESLASFGDEGKSAFRIPHSAFRIPFTLSITLLG
jgi:hypothetical protein